MRYCSTLFALIMVATLPATAEDLSKLPFPVWNVVPSLDAREDRRPPQDLPIPVAPFDEHVRRWLPTPAVPALAVDITPEGLRVTTAEAQIHYNPENWEEQSVEAIEAGGASPIPGSISDSGRVLLEKHRAALPADGLHAAVEDTGGIWLATQHGLFHATAAELTRYESYGVNGPLATHVTALALDSRGALWTGSPAGIAVREADGTWRAIRGGDGLPVEDITAIAVDPQDRLWIGTSNGLIQYRPYEEGRQWFYREGLRYLPGNHIHDIAITDDGRTIYTATSGGLGQLDVIETTLLARAQTIEKLVNERHRRLGLVGASVLDDPINPTSWDIPDNDNDGLWTAYNVAAMSLAYAVTGDPAAKASAKEGMHALYMLQNASGIPGLVARSVLPLEKAIAIGKDKDPQWRLTPDGTRYWKSDTSSDEIDGHYLAFYAYWEHIARDDPEERERCLTQLRTLTDYIVDNDYYLIDWDGEPTRWGVWNPTALNNNPRWYLESGLNSLQILSFLKTSYYITGDEKYQQHYMKLITDHHYLANVLLEKKVYPDSDNHSDNQLAYVAWYPILQIEQDPEIRAQLHKAVRRHYKAINRDRSSFFYFITATIDPNIVDLESAVLNLKRIPTDRRQWRQTNSHRADVIFDPRVDRFGDRQLMTVLPSDERCFDRWNRNLYLPDFGRGGDYEDAGADYLLPYWMARHHGFIAERGQAPEPN